MNYEIRHWGIKDQKWGERRYQNPDGSYTEEGKARRRKDYVPYEEWSDDEKNYQRLLRKDPKTMSNKELDDFRTRQEKLNKYSEMRPSDLAMYVATGIAAVATVTKIISTVNGLYSASNNLAKNGSDFTKKFAKK